MNTNPMHEPKDTHPVGTLVAMAAAALLSYAILAPAPSFEVAAAPTHAAAPGPSYAGGAGGAQPDWAAMPDGAVTPAETVAAYDR